VSAVRAELIEPGADPIDRLAGRVQQHFRAAVRRGYRTPDIEDCLVIAGGLSSINRNSENDRHFLRLQQHGHAFLRKLVAIQPLFSAESAKHIARTAKEIRLLGFDDTPVLAVLGQDAQAMAERIARLAEEIRDLLSKLDHKDEIRIFAFLAQLAWEKANEGRYPRSTEPKAPMCKFIAAALGETGMEVSISTISAVLQGRRRQYAK
jgi:hypothetical protein